MSKRKKSTQEEMLRLDQGEELNPIQPPIREENLRPTRHPTIQEVRDMRYAPTEEALRRAHEKRYR